MALSAPYQRPQRSRARILLGNLVHNQVAKLRYRAGIIRSSIGSTHRALSTDESVDYINRVFNDYTAYGGFDSAWLSGKRILEIGPGDNLGVALRLYAAGAAQVVCLDKLYSDRDVVQQAAIYRKLRESLQPTERRRYDEVVSFGDTVTIDPLAVQYRFGTAAQYVHLSYEAGAFDLIVSRAVLWEIHEIDETLESLDKVLKSGGRVVHKIACLDWMFRDNGYHPLEFLTVPDWLYRLIAEDSGKSNRRSIRYYQQKMADFGYRFQFHVVRVVGGSSSDFAPGTFSLRRGEHYDDKTVRLLDQIRPRLIAEFRTLTDEELMVEDMFLVGEKVAQCTADLRKDR